MSICQLEVAQITKLPCKMGMRNIRSMGFVLLWKQPRAHGTGTDGFSSQIASDFPRVWVCFGFRRMQPEVANVQ